MDYNSLENQVQIPNFHILLRVLFLNVVSMTELVPGPPAHSLLPLSTSGSVL